MNTWQAVKAGCKPAPTQCEPPKEPLRNASPVKTGILIAEHLDSGFRRNDESGTNALNCSGVPACAGKTDFREK